jgi:GNAT superfamily N-acetyltransferase
LRWLFSRKEVVLFLARPWNEAVDVGVEAEAVRIQQIRGQGDLPRLAPGVAGELRRRIGWKSRSKDQCYLLLVDECGVGYGWVRRTGRIAVEEIGLTLLLEESQSCFFDFYIDPSFRGRRLYTSLLRELRRRFKDISILIYSEFWNVASLAGISAAGFTVVASVHGICLLGWRFPTTIQLSATHFRGPTEQ